MMDVSVIIPTFNRASVLKRAIYSVTTQKNISFEILVIDDGSTDETRELVEHLKSSFPEIRYITQSNQGPSAARNLGIKESNTSFLAFLDSDDEWLPGKLSAQLDFFKAHPDSLICQTEEIWIRNGRRVNPMKKHKKHGGLIFERCLGLSLVSPSCVMMRREFFDVVGLFDESFPACEDYDLWLRASAQMPIELVPKFYVRRYGGHPDQQSRKFEVMDKFRIEAIRKLLKSGILTEHNTALAHTELMRKHKVIYLGAKKWRNLELLKWCETVLEENKGEQKTAPL